MDWARILAFVTGLVDQELLAQNEYLVAENRILKAQLKGRLKLTDAERATLAEIGHRLGGKALAEVATVARPDTILAWYRKLVARAGLDRPDRHVPFHHEVLSVITPPLDGNNATAHPAACGIARGARSLPSDGCSRSPGT